MEEAEGAGRDEHEPFPFDNAALAHLGKEEAAEDNLLHRAEKEEVEEKGGEGIAGLARHGPAEPGQGREGDRTHHQEEQVPANSLAAVRPGEAEFPAVKAAVDTMRDQDEQQPGQDLKAIGKGDKPRPDEQHRHVADEEQAQRKAAAVLGQGEGLEGEGSEPQGRPGHKGIDRAARGWLHGAVLRSEKVGTNEQTPYCQCIVRIPNRN